MEKRLNSSHLALSPYFFFDSPFPNPLIFPSSFPLRFTHSHGIFSFFQPPSLIQHFFLFQITALVDDAEVEEGRDGVQRQAAALAVQRAVPGQLLRRYAPLVPAVACRPVRPWAASHAPVLRFSYPMPGLPQFCIYSLFSPYASSSSDSEYRIGSFVFPYHLTASRWLAVTPKPSWKQDPSRNCASPLCLRRVQSERILNFKKGESQDLSSHSFPPKFACKCVSARAFGIGTDCSAAMR